MPRLPRISPIGIPVHIIQRGNNRQVCFASENDRLSYGLWLEKYSKAYGVEIHAWVMMTNHVHLLCTPLHENAISQMMQSLGRQYVRYFNYEHHRSGTLWEGRFKSCLVQTEKYLFDLYRYIEFNPVRAGMVRNPADYQWSSYQSNGLGIECGLCTPHPLYLALSTDPMERQKTYRALLTHQLNDDILQEIRSNSNKCMAVGSKRFKEQLEDLTGRRLKAKKRGRPMGWRKAEV